MSKLLSLTESVKNSMKSMPKKALAMAGTFAVVLAVMAIISVPAMTQESSVQIHPGSPMPNQEDLQAIPQVLTKHVANGAYFDASSPGVSLTCNGSANPPCRGDEVANLYTESIVCPGAANVKCTFEVDIAAQTNVSGGWLGLYQFLIDSAIPTGGGTDSSGFYEWESGGAAGAYTSAYSVSSQVENTSANEAHSIVVNFGCSHIADPSSSCSASSGFASLTVRVYKP
jgi:hypothetical protein